jgi:hypothetical protein
MAVDAVFYTDFIATCMADAILAGLTDLPLIGQKDILGDVAPNVDPAAPQLVACLYLHGIKS